VVFYTQWAWRSSRHIQNVYVGLRDGLPARIVLRDLDNSMLDPRRVRGRLRAARRRGKGHLAAHAGLRGRRAPPGAGHDVRAPGKVMLMRLADDHGADAGRLLAIVEHTWDGLRAFGVQQLRGWSNSVEDDLRTRLERATRLRFVRE
jgi:hypothetical protein